MDEKTRENVLKVLEHLRKRPHMYFSSEVPTVATFLEGFKMAFLLLNPGHNFDIVFKEVIVERGWEHSSQPIWHQMHERTYDDEAIIAEMLLIYSKVCEKILQQPIVEGEIKTKS